MGFFSVKQNKTSPRFDLWIFQFWCWCHLRWSRWAWEVGFSSLWRTSSSKPDTGFVVGWPCTVSTRKNEGKYRKCHQKRGHFKRTISSSNHWFLGDMLVLVFYSLRIIHKAIKRWVIEIVEDVKECLMIFGIRESRQNFLDVMLPCIFLGSMRFVF